MNKQEWLGPRNGPGQRGQAGTALSNSTTLTAIDAATSKFSFNIDELTVGDAIRWTAWGVYSSTTGTNNLTLGWYYGSSSLASATALVTTGAVTVTASASSWPWRINGESVVRAIGASGTVMSSGVFFLGTSATTWSTQPMFSASPVTIDTTTGTPLFVLGGTWSVANASNSVTCNFSLIE